MLNFMDYFTGDILSDTLEQVYFALYHNYFMMYQNMETNYDYYVILGSYVGWLELKSDFSYTFWTMKSWAFLKELGLSEREIIDRIKSWAFLK